MPFPIARFEFHFRAGSDLRMPVYKASTLRGVLGKTLRHLSCVTHRATCEGCAFMEQCAYGYLMATRATRPGERFDVNAEVARPYVIEPPLDTRQDYNADDPLVFHLNLFGRAITFFPYFLVALRELPPLGLPGRRGRLVLEEVWAVDELKGQKRRVYTQAEAVVHNVDLLMRWQDLLRQDDETISSAMHTRLLAVNFLTNTVLTYQGKVVTVIEFHVLISRLLQRIETLASLHAEPEASSEAIFTGLTPRQLVNAAKEVHLVEHSLRWNKWNRFSSTQDRKIPMGGVQGVAVYQGELEPFLPYLRLGLFTHVGKGCVMGLGKYVLETKSPEL